MEDATEYVDPSSQSYGKMYVPAFLSAVDITAKFYEQSYEEF